MTAAAQKVLDLALALSDEERALVLDGLAESLEKDGPDLHPDWDGEIRRRIEAVEKGEMKVIPGDVAMDRVRRMLRES